MFYLFYVMFQLKVTLKILSSIFLVGEPRNGKAQGVKTHHFYKNDLINLFAREQVEVLIDEVAS
jgi:hypothetical protein